MTTPIVDGDCEFTLVANLVLYGDRWGEVEGLVHERDFATQAGAMFRVLADMHRLGEPVSLAPFVARLKLTPEFQQSRTSEIAALVDDAASRANLGSLARRIADLGACRRLSVEARRIASDGAEALKDPQAYLDTSNAALTSIAAEQTGVCDVSAIGECIEGWLRTIASGQQAPRTRTGLTPLDFTLRGGFASGQLIVVGARPGEGKSALALQMARAAAQAGKGVLFVSLEMLRDELVERLMAAQTELDPQALREMSPHVQAKAIDAGQALHGLPLYVVETGRKGVRTSADASRTARQMRLKMAKAGTEMGLIVVDYLQLMRSATKAESREQAISGMTRDLKLLAQELRVPIVCLSQLNRQSASRSDPRPKLSDLRESGAIEQDADVVLLLHRRDDRTTELNVAKHRGGRTGVIDLAFDGPTTTFSEQTERGWAAE